MIMVQRRRRRPSDPGPQSGSFLAQRRCGEFRQALVCGVDKDAFWREVADKGRGGELDEL